MMLDSCQQELKKMVIRAMEDGTSDRAVRFCMYSQSEPEAVGSEDPTGCSVLNRAAGPEPFTVLMKAQVAGFMQRSASFY